MLLQIKQVIDLLLSEENYVFATLPTSQIVALQLLGVKVRNMKMDFNTGGTWC